MRRIHAGGHAALPQGSNPLSQLGPVLGTAHAQQDVSEQGHADVQLFDQLREAREAKTALDVFRACLRVGAECYKVQGGQDAVIFKEFQSTFSQC